MIERPVRGGAGAGAVELLAARSLALLRSLTEFEQKPFLDQASESPATKELARHAATRATHFAGQLAPLQECTATTESASMWSSV